MNREGAKNAKTNAKEELASPSSSRLPSRPSRLRGFCSALVPCFVVKEE